MSLPRHHEALALPTISKPIPSKKMYTLWVCTTISKNTMVFKISKIDFPNKEMGWELDYDLSVLDLCMNFDQFHLSN